MLDGSSRNYFLNICRADNRRVLNQFDACDITSHCVVGTGGGHFISSCLVDVKAPVTGLEVAVAGHHSKSFCINLAMGENVACRG